MLNIDNLGESPIAPDRPEAARFREMFEQDIIAIQRRYQMMMDEIRLDSQRSQVGLIEAYHKIAPWFIGEGGIYQTERGTKQ